MSSASKYVVIPDDFEGYPLDLFCIPSSCSPDLKSVLIPGGFVADRIKRLAQEIAIDYGNEPFVALCVLNGAYVFFTKLLQELAVYQQTSLSSSGIIGEYKPKNVEVEFIRIKSYVNSDQTTIKITGVEILESLRGKNVLIVEDIVDTGSTMVKLTELLNKYSVKSLKAVSLLVKRKPNSQGKVPNVHGYRPDYSGFEVGPQHVVGLNYDFNDNFRDVQHVCVISEEGKKNHSIDG